MDRPFMLPLLPLPASGDRRLLPPSIVPLLVGLLAFTLTADPAAGQRFGRIEDTQSNVAYFYHAQPGDATVQVSVWGTIPRPGIYEVPDSTDLDKLLTMAGGAPLQPRQENRDAATVNVRVYRPTPDSARSVLFASSIEAMLSEDTDYPLLRDDDIIVIETIQPRRRFTWRDVLSVLSSVGTVTLLALRIFDRR